MHSTSSITKPQVPGTRGAPSRWAKPFPGSGSRTSANAAQPVHLQRQLRWLSPGHARGGKLRAIYTEPETVAAQLGQLVSLIKKKGPSDTDEAIKEAERLASSIAAQLAAYTGAISVPGAESDHVTAMLADRLREQEALLSSLQNALRDSEAKRGTVSSST